MKPPSTSAYRNLCANDKSVPLFLRPVWLDAVCGSDNWDAVIVERGDTVVAAMPFHVRRERGYTILDLPRLTQFLGPWLSYPPGQKLCSRLSYQRELTAELIAALPAHDAFELSFHHSVDDWLPFYWTGHQQTTRYTYVIPSLEDTAAVFAEFDTTRRTSIRKAERSLRVVDDEHDIEKLYRMVSLTFGRQGIAMPHPLELLARLDASLAQQRRRKFFFAEDGRGRLHAALYLVWDDTTAYYLLGGQDEAVRSSGAGPLLMWRAIQFAAERVRTFDFEGSMNRTIGRYFASFGARPMPYFAVSKTSSLRLRIQRSVAHLTQLYRGELRTRLLAFMPRQG